MVVPDYIYGHRENSFLVSLFTPSSSQQPQMIYFYSILFGYFVFHVSRVNQSSLTFTLFSPLSTLPLVFSLLP